MNDVKPASPAGPRWTVDAIAWSRLAPERVEPALLEAVKTAALVEANSADYVRYLHNVFADDPAFKAAASAWGEEEAQHGAALGRWAECIDPAFDFAASLARFRAGFRLPLDTADSVRGSRSGELTARCVVESGTCSFYSALRDSTDEPVLREICHRIAQDEAMHYRLFQRHLARYRRHEPLGLLRRLRIALGRVAETGDDELAYAYYSANVPPGAGIAYDRERCARAYSERVMRRYRYRHVQGAVHMIANAAGLTLRPRLMRLLTRTAWSLLQWRLRAGSVAR